MALPLNSRQNGQEKPFLREDRGEGPFRLIISPEPRLSASDGHFSARSPHQSVPGIKRSRDPTIPLPVLFPHAHWEHLAHSS